MSNDTCTFCKLVKKEESTNLIYEDEHAIAFLDINPISEGHTLVIPKKHIETIFNISDDEIAILFKIVKRVAIAVKKGINAEGIVITQRNGIAAGQRVPHLHVHIIPRTWRADVPSDSKNSRIKSRRIRSCHKENKQVYVIF